MSETPYKRNRVDMESSSQDPKDKDPENEDSTPSSPSDIPDDLINDTRWIRKLYFLPFEKRDPNFQSISRATLTDLFSDFSSYDPEGSFIQENANIGFVLFEEEEDYKKSISIDISSFATFSDPHARPEDPKNFQNELYLGYFGLDTTVPNPQFDLETVIERFFKQFKFKPASINYKKESKVFTLNFLNFSQWKEAISSKVIKKSSEIKNPFGIVTLKHLFHTNDPQVYKIFGYGFPPLWRSLQITNYLTINHIKGIIAAGVPSDLKSNQSKRFGFIFIWGKDNYLNLLDEKKKWPTNDSRYSLGFLPTISSKKRETDKSTSQTK